MDLIIILNNSQKWNLNVKVMVMDIVIAKNVKGIIFL